MTTIRSCTVILSADDIEYSDVDEEVKKKEFIYPQTNALIFSIQIGKMNSAERIMKFINKCNDIHIIDIMSSLN